LVPESSRCPSRDPLTAETVMNLQSYGYGSKWGTPIIGWWILN
jgi:hypothetical protein